MLLLELTSAFYVASAMSYIPYPYCAHIKRNSIWRKSALTPLHLWNNLSLFFLNEGRSSCDKMRAYVFSLTAFGDIVKWCGFYRWIANLWVISGCVKFREEILYPLWFLIKWRLAHYCSILRLIHRSYNDRPDFLLVSSRSKGVASKPKIFVMTQKCFYCLL